MRTSHHGTSRGVATSATTLALACCLGLALPAARAAADPGSPAGSSFARAMASGSAGLRVAGSGSGGSGSAHGSLPDGSAAPTSTGEAARKTAEVASQVRVIQARYAAASAQLLSLQTAAEGATEKYNGARVLLGQRTTEAQTAARWAASAAAAAATAQATVGRLAAHVWMSGSDSLSSLSPFLAPGGPQTLLDQASSQDALAEIRTQALQKAQAAGAVAKVMSVQAAQAQARQASAVEAARKAGDAAKAAVETATAATALVKAEQDQLVAELAQLQDISRALVQQRQDAQQAAAAHVAALTSAASAGSSLSTGAPALTGSVRYTGTAALPAPSSRGAAKAIAFAQAQVGKWYLWGGAGPDQFDCSGLTMRAWQQAGVGLDHFTGSQYAQTLHVPISARQPGDLIFYGSAPNGIHHMGLYIGNDTMIEAPHTGAQVRYANIWRPDLIMTVGRP